MTSKVIGVAAEYNPFHTGHMYHLNRSREMIGDAAVVCVMSGSFVQRGAPSVFGKHARAEAAVRCGANLVLELPPPWAMSSAEGFARGCVGLLGALGVVTHMSFGAECAALAPLQTLAEALLDFGLDEYLREELRKGVSYASARQRALEDALGAETAALIASPNNILAVEYLKAIETLRLPIEPLTVERFGAGHDRTAQAGETHRSASELRAMLAAGEDISAFVPETAAVVFRRETKLGRGPVTLAALEDAILSRLRFLPEEAFHALPDATEGLSNRLYRAVKRSADFDDILDAAATKRYPLARLRRMLLGAALGLRAGMADGVPPYARVLAADSVGTELLRRIGERASVPIITKPAAARDLPEKARAVFELGAAAEDLYVLGYTDAAERKAGAEWRRSPVIL